MIHFAPRVMELVQDFAKTTMMFKSFGATPYGTNLRKWPARTVDAFIILQDEQNKVRNLMGVPPEK